LKNYYYYIAITVLLIIIVALFNRCNSEDVMSEKSRPRTFIALDCRLEVRAPV